MQTCTAAMSFIATHAMVMAHSFATAAPCTKVRQAGDGLASTPLGVDLGQSQVTTLTTSHQPRNTDSSHLCRALARRLGPGGPATGFAQHGTARLHLPIDCCHLVQREGGRSQHPQLVYGAEGGCELLDRLHRRLSRAHDERSRVLDLDPGLRVRVAGMKGSQALHGCRTLCGEWPSARVMPEAFAVSTQEHPARRGPSHSHASHPLSLPCLLRHLVEPRSQCCQAQLSRREEEGGIRQHQCVGSCKGGLSCPVGRAFLQAKKGRLHGTGYLGPLLDDLRGDVRKVTRRALGATAP